MFTLDDRTGNVVTTVALFLIAASVLYFARGAVLPFTTRVDDGDTVTIESE